MSGRFGSAFAHNPSGGAGYTRKTFMLDQLVVLIELDKYVLYAHAFTIKYMHLLKVVFEGELVPVGASSDMKDKFLLKSAPEYKLHLVSTETAVEDNIHLSPNSKVNYKVFNKVWIRTNLILVN